MSEFLRSAERILETPTWSENEASQARFLFSTPLFLGTKARPAVWTEDSAHLAGKILHRWIDESLSRNVSSSKLTEVLHIVLTGHHAVGFSAEQGVRWLRRLRAIPNEKPGPKTYTMIMRLFSHERRKRETVRRSVELLRECVAEGQSDTEVWNQCLVVLSECSSFNKEASTVAEDLLKEMICNGNIDEKSISPVIQGFASCGQAHRAVVLLRRVVDMGLPYNIYMFNCCISACTMHVEKAQQVFDLLVDLNHKGMGPQPDAYTFSNLINVWAKSKRPDASRRAEEILAHMKTTTVKPNVVVYTTVITALSESRCSDSTKASIRAIELQKELQSLYDTGKATDGPNTKTYTAVIHTLVNSNLERRFDIALDMLQGMKEHAADGRSELAPNIWTYNAVITVLAKSRDPHHHEIAHKLFQELQSPSNEGLVPNAHTYNSLITAFARSGRAQEAKSLLDAMVVEKKKGNASAAPTERTYASVMNAFANCRSPDSPILAMQLLSEMHLEHERGNQAARPGPFLYRAAISSLVHSTDRREAVAKAERLFRKMQLMYKNGDMSMKPNSHMLGALLRVWAVSNLDEAPNRGTELIKWAEQLYSETGDEEMKPPRNCYNFLLKIWANSGGRPDAVDRAMDIVNSMVKSGDEDMKPDGHTYRRLMWTLGNSQLPKVQVFHKQFDILKQQLLQDGFRPSYEELNSVLRTCQQIPDDNDVDVGDSVRARLEELGRLIADNPSLKPNQDSHRRYREACSKWSTDDHTLNVNIGKS